MSRNTVTLSTADSKLVFYNADDYLAEFQVIPGNTAIFRVTLSPVGQPASADRVYDLTANSYNETVNYYHDRAKLV